MRITDLAYLAYSSIIRTRNRAVLTMLGIIIGIASVILMLAIGGAAQNYLLSQVASFGSDMIFIMNGQGDATPKGPPSANIKESLTYADYQALNKQPWVRVADVNLINQDLISNGSENMFAQVYGATPGELVMYNAATAQGNFFTDEDVESHAKVVVLGADIANTLFGNSTVLDQFVTINKQNFRVIGVMQPGGTRFFSKVDDQVYIPITSVLALYNKQYVNFIALKPKGVSIDEAEDDIRWLLRDTHHLDNPQGILSKDDFKVSSQQDAAKNASTIGSILQILLASIAGISLVVAGIGIMNIMLVTVTERTQEIGLRKSIGAREADILGQFLLESIGLTFVGGVIGILLGLGTSYGFITVIGHFQSGWAFVFPTGGVILSAVVSTVIGIVFGYYPARKAARLKPIEALRYE